jgi:hypothetical protein
MRSPSLMAYGSGMAVMEWSAWCPSSIADSFDAIVLPLILPFSFVEGRLLAEPFIPIIFAAFVFTLPISVSVCGGDIMAASPSTDGRREVVLDVAGWRTDLDREGGAPNSEKLVPRTGLVRGTDLTLSDPDDFDMTSLSLVEGTRADFDRAKLGGAAFAGVAVALS